MSFTYNVSVTVVDDLGINNPPVADASVAIMDSSGFQIVTGSTNAAGQFLATGTYNGPDTNGDQWTIRVIKPHDYAAVCASNKIPLSPVIAQTIYLGKGINPLRCDVEVVDFAGPGLPVAGAVVAIRSPDGRRRGMATTGSDGKAQLIVAGMTGDGNSMDGWSAIVVDVNGNKKYNTGSGCWVRPTGYRQSMIKIRLVPLY